MRCPLQCALKCTQFGSKNSVSVSSFLNYFLVVSRLSVTFHRMLNIHIVSLSLHTVPHSERILATSIMMAAMLLMNHI